MHFTEYTHRKAWRMAVRPYLQFFAERPAEASLDLAELFEGREGRSLHVIVTHPDDEAFCSGLILEASSQGLPVVLTVLTRGEGGSVLNELEQPLGEIREAEVRESARVLGVRQTTFLDYVDPPPRGETARRPRFSAPELTVDLMRCISEANAGVVVTHGSSGEYWHPGHLLTHDFVCHAVARLIEEGGDMALLTMNAWRDQGGLPEIMNEDDPPDLVLDGTRWQERRVESLNCHRSQVQVFAKFASGTVDDFIRLTSIEAYHRLY